MKMPTWKEWIVIGLAVCCLFGQWYAMTHTKTTGAAPAAPAAAKP